MNELITIQTQLPMQINQAAVATVQQFMPEIEEKTRAFDRNNSQTTLSLATLTLLNGQSPMRMLRQVMAEIEKRKLALVEAQLTHAEMRATIEELEQETQTPLVEVKIRTKSTQLVSIENKINGAFKDIATLIDSYNGIKATYKIDEWDEETFEREEKRHHTRRGFELMYRNLLEGGRAQTATIEYLQQYGIHPQVALTEVSGYIKYTADRIARAELLHANDLEEFLDQMADKYFVNADKTSERIFGKANIANTDYMMRLENKGVAE